MEEKQWEGRKKQREGGVSMTTEKALTISPEEFKTLRDECNGFNDGVYRNHQLHNNGESIGDFLRKGSLRLMENPVIKGNLGD